MKKIFFLYIFLLVLFSCQLNEQSNAKLLKGEIKNDFTFKEFESYLIEDSLNFINASIVFEQGVTLFLGDNAHITFKNCFVKSTSNFTHPVVLTTKSEVDFWDRLYVFDSDIALSNFRFENGLISLYQSSFMLDSLFMITTNDRINYHEYPFIYIIKSNGDVKNSVLKNPVKKWTGEGIVVEDGKVNVENNFIEFIPDAIEFTRVKNSSIRNNKIVSSLDDGIDLNACRDILIFNNTVIASEDKGISIGGDYSFSDKLHPVKWGKSRNITIEDNTILNCKIGIAIKDSSEVYLKNNRIENNTTNKVIEKSSVVHIIN